MERMRVVSENPEEAKLNTAEENNKGRELVARKWVGTVEALTLDVIFVS